MLGIQAESELRNPYPLKLTGTDDLPERELGYCHWPA